ncbi:hypothetical protein ACF06W_31395 [Streptomyces albus]|uniref:hypothetical protein n=1 Tax=Streptomyces albus TaxID=1888 RepID=UPI0036FC988D
MNGLPGPRPDTAPGPWRDDAYGWDVPAFWETRPRVLELPGQAPAFDEDELFALACAAAARRTALPDPQDVRLFADDHLVNPSRIDAYLPSPQTDEGFRGYAHRMRKAGVRTFALTVNSLQQFDWEFFRTLRRHTAPVLAAAGTPPPGGVDCHLIASVYGTAPTHVHKDTAGVLTYVVSGYKRYCTWPFEVFADIAGDGAAQRQVNLPASVRAEDHLDTATVVEGGPGTVLYWPSDRWHCALSDGRPAVSLHLAHYQWEDRLETLLRRLRRLTTAELGVRRFHGGRDGADGTAVDTQVHKTVSRLLEDTALGLHTGLRRLQRETATHFAVVPPPRERPRLAPHDPLTVPTGSALRARTADDLTYLAVNGHLLRAGGGAWLDAFLPALAPGTTRTAAEWAALARAAGASFRDDAATLLAELVRYGALDAGAAG